MASKRTFAAGTFAPYLFRPATLAGAGGLAGRGKGYGGRLVQMALLAQQAHPPAYHTRPARPAEVAGLESTFATLEYTASQKRLLEGSIYAALLGEA